MMTTEKSTTQKLATYRTVSKKQHNGLFAQTGIRAGKTENGKDWTQIYTDQIGYKWGQGRWDMINK